MFRPTFWPSSVTIENNRNTHKLFKYDVAVTKLNCLIVFIVICTNNSWKAEAIHQQPDHILSFKRAAHTTRVTRKSNTMSNLCVFLLLSIVTEDGQKVGRNVTY